MKNEENIVISAKELFESSEDKTLKELEKATTQSYSKNGIVKPKQSNEIKNEEKSSSKESEIDLKQQEKEDFEFRNQSLLSETQLKDFESAYKQTIKLSPEEQNNPEIILDFLKTIKEEFDLELSNPKNADFFKTYTKNNRPSKFNEILDELYGNDELRKAYARMFINLYMLNRKVLTFGFKNNLEYNFTLRDLYAHKHFELECFNSINDIPTNICQKNKIKRQPFTSKVNKYTKTLKKLEKALFGVVSAQSNLFADESTSQEEAESKARELDKKRKSIEEKIIDLSSDISDELSVDQRTESPTADEVAEFIANFFTYSLKIEPNEMKQKSKNQIKITEDKITTSLPSIIKNTSFSNLYVQNLDNYKWIKMENIFNALISHIAPKSKFSKADKDAIADKIVSLTKNKKCLNVIAFKLDCIFVDNGVIELSYKTENDEKKPLTYQFLKFDEMSLKDIMYTYATDYRCTVVYNDEIDYSFTKYENVEITPKHIFNHLGEKGYEVTKDTDKREKEILQKEAKARTNLLMQYFLKILLPYNDIDVVKETMLYFYNAQNSGKTTFIKLMQNIIGADDYESLKYKDINSKSEFGLSATIGKKMLVLDEFTDGKTLIDCERLKDMASKSQMTENVKFKNAIKFQFIADIIIASNNQPKLSDTSGGTERRLLAFELASGYEQHIDENSPKFELKCIRESYIKEDEFKSACIKWALNNVDIHQFIPESIKESANSIISQEDDVQEFIIDVLQPEIDKPTFFSEGQLYNLYMLSNLTSNKGSRTRNKSNFAKAIAKMSKRVKVIKSMNYSKLDNLNKYIKTESQLFYSLYRKLTNNPFKDAYTKDFQKTIQNRSKELQRVYQQINDLKLGNVKYASQIGRSKAKMYCVLPDNEIYEGFISEKQLKDIANDEQKKLINTMLKSDDNIKKVIYNENDKSVPVFMRANVSDDINSYTNDNEYDSELYPRILFDEFVNY
ncbi:TPA: hypothetical protein VL584_001649 [Streptococcus pyogenes]|nr:hypothetical protein [Streptococcus pyogenes]